MVVLSCMTPQTNHRPPKSKTRSFGFSIGQAAPAVVALAAVLAASPPLPDTLSNIPPTLSGEDRKQERIQHPKSAKAMQCTSKCVSTCILGGAGSPGEGPFTRFEQAACGIQGTIPKPAILPGGVLGHLQSNQGWRRRPLRQINDQIKAGQEGCMHAPTCLASSSSD